MGHLAKHRATDYRRLKSTALGDWKTSRDPLLTAVENGDAGAVSRRSKMAAHNRAVFWEGRIGAIAPTTPPYRERHRSAQRHGDLERDSA